MRTIEVQVNNSLSTERMIGSLSTVFGFLQLCARSSAPTASWPTPLRSVPANLAKTTTVVQAELSSKKNNHRGKPLPGFWHLIDGTGALQIQFSSDFAFCKFVNLYH